MSGEHDDNSDARIHSYLDGELDPSEAEAFEQLLHARPDLMKKVSTLREMQHWVRATRPEAPPSVATSVLRLIESEPKPSEAEAKGSLAHTRTSATRSRRFSWDRVARVASRAQHVGIPPRGWNRFIDRLRPPWRWGIAVATGIAVVVVAVNLTDGVRDDERFASTPDEGAIALEQPPGHVEGRQDAERVRHQFVFEAQDAREVCLVGNFNRWHVCSTPMVHAGEGRWQVALDLPAGKHEYMFVVDNTWVSDPEAPLHVDDGFGNQNAVLLLPVNES
jgi:hypothetical protein